VADLPCPTQLSEGASLSFSGSSYKKNLNFDQPVCQQFCAFVPTANYAPVYFNSNVQNEQQALWARVLKKRLVPDELMDEFVTFVKKHIHTFLKRKKVRSDTIHDYLQNSNACPSVKKAILVAHNKLMESGITQTSSLSAIDLYRYSTRKSFVKVENLNYSSDGGVKKKAPRLIQGATPEFISLVGPFFSAFQRYMKEQWSAGNFLYFTSGATNVSMGKFIDIRECWHLFEDDVGAWDASFSEKLCQLEVWISDKFGAPRAVLDLMQANIKTHGYTTNGWKYSCVGTRKSGDPFTSCYNSLFNALLHLFVFHKQTGIRVENLHAHIRMMVMGDDNLMRHAGVKIDFPPMMLRLGFETVGMYRPETYQAEFCSSIMVRSAHGTVFIPKPGKMLCKVGYFVQPPLLVAPRQLLRGVALGFQSLVFVPWFAALVASLLQFVDTMPDQEKNKKKK